jgi:LPXTG-site transpeptidase (sortase) family protein
VLIGAGALGLIVSALLVVYPTWAEWHARVEQAPEAPAPEELAETSPLLAETTPETAPRLAETTPPGPPSADAAGTHAVQASPAAADESTMAETPGNGYEPAGAAALPAPAAEADAVSAAEADAPADAEDSAEADAESEAAQASPAEAPSASAPAEAPPASASAGYGRATWITIPRIGVDSRVVEVSLLGSGEFQAPSFAVGHHVGSPDPGAPGNSVFAGHLTSINAGRVFARLRELRPGDAVYLYSSGYRLDWSVSGVRTVPNTDNSFIFGAGDTRITLYTCAGQFLPLSQDYSHRLVVTGRLVRVTARS